MNTPVEWYRSASSDPASIIWFVQRKPLASHDERLLVAYPPSICLRKRSHHQHNRRYDSSSACMALNQQVICPPPPLAKPIYSHHFLSRHAEGSCILPPTSHQWSYSVPQRREDSPLCLVSTLNLPIPFPGLKAACLSLLPFLVTEPFDIGQVVALPPLYPRGHLERHTGRVVVPAEPQYCSIIFPLVPPLLVASLVDLVIH